MTNHKKRHGFPVVNPFNRIRQRALVKDLVSLRVSMDSGNKLPCHPSDFDPTDKSFLTRRPAPSLHSRKMTAESGNSRTCPSKNPPASILLSLTKVAWVLAPCQTTETAWAAQGPSFTNCQFPTSEWMPNRRLALSRSTVRLKLNTVVINAAIETAKAHQAGSKFMPLILGGVR